MATANSVTLVNNLVFENIFPKLSQTAVKSLLSAYGYLSRDFSLTTMATVIPDGDKLRADGMLTALWTEYVFAYPTPVLTAHPATVKAGLKTQFLAGKSSFLSKIDSAEAYSLINDESSVSNTPFTKYLVSWSYTYGANRFINFGNGVNPNSGQYIGFNEQAHPGLPPVWDTVQLNRLTTRLQALPSGYRGAYVRPLAFCKFDPLSGVSYYDNSNIGNTDYWFSFAYGAPQSSIVDTSVQSAIGVASGTASYTIPSGYAGIYFDSWDEVTKRAHAYFGPLRQQIGPILDLVYFDTENHWAALPYNIKGDKYYNGYGGRTAVASMPSGSKPWDQIIRDPRWLQLVTDYPIMPYSGYVSDMGNWGIYPDKNSFVFSEINYRRMAKQFNDKVFAVIKYYNPNVRVCNYYDQYKSPMTMPVQIPHYRIANPSGVGSILGNRQSTANYMSLDRVGADTGIIYKDELGGSMSSRLTYPPLSDFAYANGVPHSGGFITFVQEIRKQRSGLCASQVPMTNWIPQPLDSPYYPQFPYKSVALGGQSTRRTGQWDHLFDEMVAHSLLNCEDTFVYNTMDTTYLTLSSSGPQYPVSGDPTLLIPTGFSPTGLLNPNGTSSCVIWLDPSDLTKMTPSATGLNLGSAAVSGRIGYIASKIGSYAASGNLPVVSTSYPVLASGNETRSLQPMLKCNPGQLTTSSLGSGTFQNGYTYFVVATASNSMSSAGIILGPCAENSATSYASPQDIYLTAGGVPQIFSANISLSNGSVKTFDAGGSCALIGMTFDPYKVAPAQRSLPESVESVALTSTMTNGDQADQTNTQDDVSGFGVLTSASGFIAGTAFDGNLPSESRMCIGGKTNFAGNTYFSQASQARILYVGDVMVFNRVLTDGELRQLQAWAYRKYQPLDGTGKPISFSVYPSRSDRKAANERVSNMLLELEGLGGNYRATPEPWSEFLDHVSVSGIVSTAQFYNKKISRVTPNPTLLSQLSVTSNASGVHFKLGSWEVDFPRGVIANNGASYLVQPPSGYWVVQTNRAGTDASDFATARLQVLMDIYGTVPGNVQPTTSRVTTTATYGSPQNINKSVIPFAGNTTRVHALQVDRKTSGVQGSNPAKIISAVTSGTNNPVAQKKPPYLPSVVPNNSPNRSIAADARKAGRPIKTTTSINTQSDQPTRPTPGRVTFSTGSKIPRSSSYSPKNE